MPSIATLSIDFSKTFWKLILVVITPLILIPIITENNGSSESRCGYCLALMAVYWMTSALPLPVTALLPVFLFPALGILSSEKTTEKYGKETVFLVLGALVLGEAVEETNLHKRLSYRVLLLLGSRPPLIMLGFMITTAFVSMWINNTACAGMMLPLAITITEEMVRFQKQIRSNHQMQQADDDSDKSYTLRSASNELEYLQEKRELEHREDVAATDGGNARHMEAANFGATTIKLVESSKTKKQLVEDFVKAETNFTKAILLSICYAANIGGTGTITGSGTNAVLAGYLDNRTNGTTVTVVSWMQFNIPSVIVCLFLTWIWLQIWFLGCKDSFRFLFCCGSSNVGHKTAAVSDRVHRIIRKEYELLGRCSFAEVVVGILFVVLVGLWVANHPDWYPKNDWLKHKYNGESAFAIGIAVLLHFLPRELPDFRWFKKIGTAEYRPPKRREAILKWSVTQRKLTWGVLFLLGGGFALAEGIDQSGLSKVLGNGLFRILSSLSKIEMCAVIVIGISFITELTSNVATASIMVPLVATLAKKNCLNPIYFALPATLACSFSFMLPVATPPNALIYSSGKLSIIDMILSGFIVNLICCACLLLNINTFGVWLFGLDEFPEWALTGTGEHCRSLLNVSAGWSNDSGHGFRVTMPSINETMGGAWLLVA